MKYLLTISFLITICFCVNIVRIPNIKAVEINESSESVKKTNKSTSITLDQHIISQIPDLRSIAGSPGKNIVFAEDGQNIAVIYSRFSGDPTNFMQVYVAYSTDRGTSWIHYGPLSTFNCRRAYSAIDAEPHWPNPTDLNVYFAWNQAPQYSGSYDSSPSYYAKEAMYPDGLITGAGRLPNSGKRDVWSPCIGVKDSFIIITATNNGTFLTTYDSYIWRCVGSAGWDSGRIFIPGPLEKFGPHFRFGNNGYMFFLWMQQLETNPDQYWPYYCESFNYALTWTEPRPIVLPDTISAWWYDYNCEVVGDTPVTTVKFHKVGFYSGDIWVYRPDSGGPGNWRFKAKKLIDDTLGPPFYAGCPTIAADDSGSIFIGYQAFFVTPSDTGPDIGLFVRPAWQDTWIDWGRITFNSGDLEEKWLEFAHNAPIVGTFPNDSVIIGMIYNDAGDYPTTGNLYFDWFAIPYDSIRRFQGVVEIDHKIPRKFVIKISPNPFHNFVKFTITPNTSKITLEIFDISGKLIRQLTGDSEMIWDGRKTNGTKSNPGVYFYILSTKDNQYQGKMILTR